MEYPVKIRISNRHVHLTKETYEQLFFEPLEKERDLNQIGEFASNQFVTLKTQKNQIEKVRVVGPLRQYNQVEISKSDAFLLGLNPPVRKSGDIEHSENITLIGPKGEVYLESCCILAQRHIHMNLEEAKEYGVNDEELVKVRVNGERSGVLDAFIKVSENGYFEMHIDRDEANAMLIKDNDEGTLMIEK